MISLYSERNEEFSFDRYSTINPEKGTHRFMETADCGWPCLSYRHGHGKGEG
jgi:hypothetical protein